MEQTIFKRDDIVGIYPDQLKEEDAWKIGSATARFLPSLLRGYQRGQANAQSICVGRDMRTHSEPLAKALIEGMNSTGVNVIDIGMIDTPQLYFAVNHIGTCGGVQVTASHKPAKYNGFKMTGIEARPVGLDTGLKDIEHIALAMLHTKGHSYGSVRQLDLTAEYKSHVLKFLDPKIRKLKVAIDASNGMAGKMLPAIFGDLPLEIVDRNFQYAVKFKHEPNPLIEANLAQVKSAVKRNRCDFGVCFDGDAERLIMVDEKGDTVSSDLLTALLVPYFLEKQPKSAVVYDLRSSRVVVEEIIKYGGTPRRERVGHAYMKKALRDSRAIFGGGLSGHFYYRDNFFNDSGPITLVHIINLVSRLQKPLSEQLQPLRRYNRSGELNFEVEDKQAMMDALAKKYNDGQIDHLDGVTIGYKDWWFNCRPSNSEPLLRLNLEAKSEETLNEKVAEIKALLGEPAEK